MKISEFGQILLRQQQANPEAARLRHRLAELWVRLIHMDLAREMDWLTQSQAAEYLGVHRAQIHRAIKKGKLETNGLTGHACRVNPASLWAHWFRREQQALARTRQSARED